MNQINESINRKCERTIAKFTAPTENIIRLSMELGAFPRWRQKKNRRFQKWRWLWKFWGIGRFDDYKNEDENSISKTRECAKSSNVSLSKVEFCSFLVENSRTKLCRGRIWRKETENLRENCDNYLLEKNPREMCSSAVQLRKAAVTMMQ